MKVSRSKTRIVLAVLAMAASAGAQAGKVTNVTMGGSPCGAWLPNFASAQTCDAPNVFAALDGQGSVELGKYGSSPATTMTFVTGSATTVVLSNPVLADWGNAMSPSTLALDYLQNALATGNIILTPAQLQAAAAWMFVPLSSLGGKTVVQRVSDPNVSQIDDNGASFSVTLDGFFNVTPILTGIANSINALQPGTIDLSIIPANAQASEVLKVTYDGLSRFQYGFAAYPTGYSSPDGSFTGAYSLVPEPESLALLGLGLVGLFVGRRRLV